ncbi:MAG: sulfatase, partial [Bacteroidota bacterium]
MKKIILYLGILLVANSCIQKTKQVNFLIISCEDISPYLSFYGDSTAHTPNLDKLASEGIVFENAFTTVGVCAPNRSSIITGMYPVSIGTHHMRTGTDIKAWGKRSYDGNAFKKDQNGDRYCEYSTVLPPDVKCFTTYLRKAGYYCTNTSKTDYQFSAPLSAWDENGDNAHYKNRKENQPFFAVFNLNVTHESQIWMSANDSLRINPQNVSLHPYWPDTDSVRIDMARNYSNIELLDKQVGTLLHELESTGELENTIIFFFSDHGGPLARGKRAIYDSGLKVPFIVRFPDGSNTGRNDQLISFVDIAPTILSLAGIKVPDHIQGKAFLGKQQKVEREYIFGSSDRFDEHYDRIRCIRNKQYLLVRNYYPDQPGYLDIAYRKQLPMMREMLRMRNEGKLNQTQRLWFNAPKPEIEFYDVMADPDQINDLAQNAGYKEIIDTMLNRLSQWQVEIDDKGAIPEAKLVKDQWPDFKQPQTKSPTVTKTNERYYA